MFTGIVESQALVTELVPRGQAYRIVLEMGALSEGLQVGDSVAIDGTCLTAVAIQGGRVSFDVIRETVERTAFATLRVRDRVNVERSMRADGRFHGHFVAGHVDCTGRVAVLREEPGQVVMKVEVNERITAFMVEKGSIALSGVSLTLTEVSASGFAVALIPHTLEVTTLGSKTIGSLINVEVDQLGKFVHRFLTAYVPTPSSTEEGDQAPQILSPGAAFQQTLDHLRRSGFVGEDRAPPS